MQIAFGHLSQHENLPKIKEAAKSLEIDYKLGEAHYSLGLVGWLENDLFRAEQ
jgi:hypothetical protein